MADTGIPVHVQAERLIEAFSTVAEHLDVSAKQPVAGTPHLTAPAAPVDAAAAQAAAAMRTMMAEMSAHLAAKGPATQQAAAAAAAALQAQDGANSARMPSVPAPPGGASGAGLGSASRGAQMLGSGPPGLAPPPRAPGQPPAPPPPPPPRSPLPRPTGPPPAEIPDPRLRHLPSSEWAQPAPPPTSDAAKRAYKGVIDDIEAHNSWRPDPGDPVAVSNYNQEARWLNQSKQSLEGQLNGWKASYDASATSAAEAQTPFGTPNPAPHSPQHHPLDITTQHARDLGTDPATGGRFRPSEAETALRVERERGITLQRSPHEGADWIDPATGQTYDGVGNFDARFLDLDDFCDQIRRHAGKVDYVPVDISTFTEEQRTFIRRFIDGLGNPRVFIVGDYGSGG